MITREYLEDLIKSAEKEIYPGNPYKNAYEQEMEVYKLALAGFDAKDTMESLLKELKRLRSDVLYSVP